MGQYSVTFYWNNNNFKCPLCQEWTANNQKMQHFLSSKHSGNVHKLGEFEERFAWKNLSSRLDLLQQQDKENQFFILNPVTKNNYSYLLKQVIINEINNKHIDNKVKELSFDDEFVINGINNKCIDNKMKQLSFDEELELAIKISKDDYQYIDEEMTKIQLNAIEFENKRIEEIITQETLVSELYEDMKFICIDQ